MNSIKQTPHSFWPNEAEKFGIAKAILIFDMRHWLTQHKNNNQRVHIRNGYVWMFNTSAAFALRYPYMSQSTISRHLKELEADGFLLSSNEFNRAGYDRTKWYTIPSEFKITEPEAATGVISQNENSNSQNEETISQNEKLISQNEQTIPNTYSDTYTDTESNSNSSLSENLPYPLDRAKQQDAQRLNTYQQKRLESTCEPITENWQPSDVAIARILQKGITEQFIRAEVDEFISYWILRGHFPKSKNWNSAFFNHIDFKWNQYLNKSAGSGQVVSGWSAGVEEELVL